MFHHRFSLDMIIIPHFGYVPPSSGSLERLLSAFQCLFPSCSCKHFEPHLPSIFLFPRSHPGEISRNQMWCQGCCEFPNKTTGRILQEYGCARMGRTDGWTCRTSFSHKCCEHRKCLVPFIYILFFWKLKYIWEVLVQTADSVKY